MHHLSGVTPGRYRQGHRESATRRWGTTMVGVAPKFWGRLQWGDNVKSKLRARWCFVDIGRSGKWVLARWSTATARVIDTDQGTFPTRFQGYCRLQEQLDRLGLGKRGTIRRGGGPRAAPSPKGHLTLCRLDKNPKKEKERNRH